MDRNVRGRIDSKGKYEKVSANDMSTNGKKGRKEVLGVKAGTSFDRNGRVRVLLKRKRCKSQTGE